jgi:NAD(P)H-dependent FMN reductase
MDAFFVIGPDGIMRSLSEHYDEQRDVEQDPYGAWLAIQNQADRIEELEARIAKADALLLEVRNFNAGKSLTIKQLLDAADDYEADT